MKIKLCKLEMGTPIEAFTAMFLLPQLLVLLAEIVAAGTSTRVSAKEFNGVFSDMV
jgi:hypothetical protein